MVIAQTNTHIQSVCVEVTANVITSHCGHLLKNMNFAKQNCAFSVTLEHGLPHVSHYNDFEIRPINLSDTLLKINGEREIRRSNAGNSSKDRFLTRFPYK